MNRAEIPDALLKARRADIDKIPGRVLKTLTRAGLTGLLLASGEYRRRAGVPHLDGDLLGHRLGLAREVLETDDPKRAAELIKGAGVAEAVLNTALRPAGAPRPAVRPAVGTRTSRAATATRRPSAADMSYITAEVAWQRSPAGRALAKAAEYERKAYVVTDPETRRGYLDLAKGLRTQTA